MCIKNIEVNNFKSFRNIDLELGNFNIFIGSNASGKSNFIRIFEFLRDIAVSGLDNAISIQGGVEYLRNISIGVNKELSVKVLFEHSKKTGFGSEIGSDLIGIKVDNSIYEFVLKLKELDFEIIKDTLTQYIDFFKLEKYKKQIKEKEKIGSGKMIFYQEKGKMKVKLTKSKEVNFNKTNRFPLGLVKSIGLPPGTIIVEHPFFRLLEPEEMLSKIAIYDFDPKLPKKATSITGKSDLEEDGSNLSIVLKNLISNDEKRRKYMNLVKDLLPFVTDLNVEKFADKSLLFTLREVYSKEHYLPASLISDGTINITALIIALYFEKNKLTIIEEPERNIHPHLISKLVNMMKDASSDKQIIVTTHNPEIIKHADLKDIFLVSRDKDGFSTISKPSEKKEIKIFLENEMGIDELYVQNLLEI
ncbi:MAG: AAA family ATPase [Candidatus Eremiobacterota bacterium]